MTQVKYVKKLIGNMYKISDDENDITDVVLSRNDYAYLQNCIQELTAKLNDREYKINDINKTIETCKNNNNALKVRLNEAEAANKMLNERIASMLQDRVRIEGINNSFIRQIKERSNAEKGLYPKKKHTGYVLKSSRTKDIYYDGKKQIYETSFVSPYSLEYEYNDVEDMIYSNWFNSENDYFSMLGISEYIEESLDDINSIIFEDEKIKSNCAFNFRIVVYGDENRWGITFNHSKVVSQIPAVFRRVTAKKGKKNEKKV